MNYTWKGLLVILISFAFASCTDTEESSSPMLESNLKSIPEVLKTMEKNSDSGDLNARKNGGNTYATFNAALGKSGLASVFAKNELTVFAPNDAAFAELGLNPGNIGDLEGLTDILLYHVVAGSVYSSELVEGFVPTINGIAVKISLADGPMVNDSNIILTDKMARNGVIHGIDAVLFPPMENVMELLDNTVSTTGDFTTLQAAIDAVPDLRETLIGLDGITIFAPNDEAFNKVGLNAGTVGFFDTDRLANILQYHVFGGGVVFSSDLMDGDITMLQGGTLTVDTSGPSLIDENNRDSDIILTDLQASNGIIHGISDVILPLNY